MTFQGIIETYIKFKEGLGDDNKQKVVDSLMEFLPLISENEEGATFREENFFSEEFIINLKVVLENLKKQNLIEKAEILIWVLEYPDEKIEI